MCSNWKAKGTWLPDGEGSLDDSTMTAVAKHTKLLTNTTVAAGAAAARVPARRPPDCGGP